MGERVVLSGIWVVAVERLEVFGERDFDVEGGGETGWIFLIFKVCGISLSEADLLEEIFFLAFRCLGIR